MEEPENKPDRKSAHEHFQIRLEDAVKENEKYLFTDIDVELRPNANLANATPKLTLSSGEIRKNFRTLVSGRLATGLWCLLGGVVTIHMVGITHSASRLARFATAPASIIEEANIDLRTQLLKDSVGLIDSSAKTLYSFLTPLATAVTGYYFSAVETAVEQKKESQEASSNSDEENEE